MLHLAGRTSLQNFGNSVYPALPASFGGDNKSRRSLLSGVYTRGSKRSHAGGKCETCRGLHNCQGMTTQITLCIILKFECSRYRKKRRSWVREHQETDHSSMHEAILCIREEVKK